MIEQVKETVETINKSKKPSKKLYSFRMNNEVEGKLNTLIEKVGGNKSQLIEIMINKLYEEGKDFDSRQGNLFKNSLGA